ncbi:MAG: GntR family transcriptional regulator [Firmicutes bacterium]|nr:GntR family transcriptional regulator [Bacillota bacterium]
MNVVISNRSAQPIYEQIKEQIRTAIIRDEIAEGEMLPSIRLLAHDLKVSVITTKRAYDELEAEGFIATVHGKGCFVLPKNKEQIREQKLREVEHHLNSAIAGAKSIGVTPRELVELLKILSMEEN